MLKIMKFLRAHEPTCRQLGTVELVIHLKGCSLPPVEIGIWKEDVIAPLQLDQKLEFFIKLSNVPCSHGTLRNFYFLFSLHVNTFA
jgi:hypothetical protein